MKALILAAGLGTRLKPLSDKTPKALIKINEITLLERTITKLKQAGFDQIIVNVHHHANQIISFLNANNNFNIEIVISDEQDQLLDTGGGIKKTAWFFDDGKPFLIHNVDIVSDIDLNDLYHAHSSSDAIATLAVKERDSQRYFLFDEKNNLSGWENFKTGEYILTRHTSNKLEVLTFSGIHMVSPEIFNLITETGKFSIVPVYLRLSKDHIIKAYRHTGQWIDVGKIETLELAQQMIK